MSTIVSIGTAVPEFKYAQKEIAAFMVQALGGQGNGLERKINALYSRSGIHTRHSPLPDYRAGLESSVLMKDEAGKMTNPSVEERLEMFHEKAFPLAKKAIEDCMAEASNNSKAKVELDSITHFISVSCTGLSAPGLEIEIPQRMNFRKDITRFAVNFIGCYAAFHAMKIADAICRSDKAARVLIVCTELCSLHFQPSLEKDDLVSNALFADGASATLITSDEDPDFIKRLSIDTFCTQIEADGQDDMAWKISSSGFLMTLTSYVPALIQKGMKTLADTTLEKLDLNQNDIQHWAIHPGGRKILEACEMNLELSSDQLESSWKILSEYGNMSSATILFVLKNIWENEINWDQKESIFASGFGPGLTMETAILSSLPQDVH